MRTASTKKQKEPPVLLIPEANPRIKRWVVLGLDPSMTRTGFALLDVRPVDVYGTSTRAIWLAAGSLKPEIPDVEGLHTKSTLWQRSKALSIYLREMVKSVAPSRELPGVGPDWAKSDAGLIISMEFPTPRNDFLVTLNRIIHLVFFEDGVLADMFGEIRIMLTNAATLRSLNGLVKRGNDNKGENIRKAYEFIDRGDFPELDSDSCDAVLLAMMARHASSVMLGTANEIPTNFLNSLCNATQDVKGKGRNARTVTRGLLHRTEYWYRYERIGFVVRVKDATNPKKSLSRINFSI